MKKAIIPGDIIIVQTAEYIGDYTQKNISYKKPEFSHVRRAWKVDDISNNGRIIAHDFRGGVHYIHALDKPPYMPYIIKIV